MNTTMARLREGLRLLEDVGGSPFLSVVDGLPFMNVAAVNTPPEYDADRLRALGWSGSGTDWKLNF